jgi:hypothetical protein
MRQNKYEYDAFISHAVEDKIPIANELCAKLEMAGLKIWYSGKELGVGDSIEKTIEKGLNRSRYGIVIFSPTYLAKNWTIREFYTLLAKEIEEQKVILPVLYNITLDDLKNKDLLMADRFAVNADKGIDFVVERLVREIRKPKVVREKVAWFSRIWLVLILSLIANIALVVKAFFPGEDSGLASGDEAALFQSGMVTPTLLGEMRGLVSQLNTCSCDHAPATRVASRSIGGQTKRVVADDSDRADARNSTVQHTGKGRQKMTMAVVFQVETDSPAGESFSEELDIPEVVDDQVTGSPFIAASNRGHGYTDSHRQCSHTVKMAD